MKKLAIILCGFVALARAGAQEPAAVVPPTPTPTATPPPVVMATQAFALTPGSGKGTFFNDKLVYQQELESEAKSDAPGGYAIYPRQSEAETTATAQFRGFFTDMFASIHLGKKDARAQTAAKYLEITPAKFSPQFRHEVSADYTIRNTGKKLVLLEYANGQRIELITTDPTGKVIDRWSDDRTFDPQNGTVVINPGERVEYSEKIPTRDMVPGQTYKVSAQATTVTSPYYSTTTAVTPQAAPPPSVMPGASVISTTTTTGTTTTTTTTTTEPPLPVQ